MARFLIVGEGGRASALTAILEREGHALNVIGRADPLGPLLAALEHVAIVCWLADASPERFLLGAVDSAMRCFVCDADVWGPAASETAARNSIPVAIVRADRRDAAAWAGEAQAAIQKLLAGGGDASLVGGVPGALS